MSAIVACLACRARKVKCVPGPSRRCERCTTMGFRDCVYEPIKKRGVGKILRVGEACKSCRARKKRCDAERPCTRCVEANRALECEYEIAGVPPDPSAHPRFLIWNPSPPGAEDVSTTDRWAVEGDLEAFVGTPSSATEIVPPARALIRALGSKFLPPDLSPSKRQPHGAEAHLPPHIRLSPTFVLLSLTSPRIPPEPHVTLSSLGAERFQLSDAALGELDMKFRLRVLCRLNKLGIRLTSEKQRAMLCGDVSGTVINPYFVHASQSLGMYFCDGVDNSPVMIRLQAKYVQTSLEFLVDILKGHDWELRAQATLWATAASVVVPVTNFILRFIQKGCEAINVGGLRFIPTNGRPPEYSEDLHEKLSVLSQVIYFENFFFLTCGGPEPTLTTRIEEEFRYQLQDVYPVLFKICPLTMRTRAILLVRDTVVMLSDLPTDEVRLGIWNQSCDRLVSVLDSYSQTLLSNLQRFQGLGDKSGAGMIRISCVNCLAHLAVLCETLGRMEPSRTQLGALCDSILERLGELTGDMRMEEYTRLDLLLGVSWEKALTVFDARLATAPPEHGTNLRHWRETVAEVHSVFVAKVPGPGPRTLIRRISSEDARSEGSRYPNMMRPGALAILNVRTENTSTYPHR